MTADQRAELLKRVVTDEPHKKLSFRECREIAKDLNLTLEQVCLLLHCYFFFLVIHEVIDCQEHDHLAVKSAKDQPIWL